MKGIGNFLAITRSTPVEANMAEDLGAYAWFVAQIKPNSHRVAERNLTRQGFETFCPKEQTTERVGSKFRPARRLLFPGYLFVRLDPSKGEWRAVNSTTGVAKLVQTGEHPVSIPTGLVDVLRVHCDKDETWIGLTELQPGEQVRMTSGPFTDFLAEVEKVDAAGRAYVLINLMERQIRLTTDVSGLRKSRT